MPQVLWLTQRGERHQQSALDAAPDGIRVTMLREPASDVLAAHLADADFLVSERSGAISAGLLAGAPRLKLILRLGSLAYDIDLDACREREIAVSLQPVVFSSLVAEHVLMMMLALKKRLNTAQHAIFSAEHGLPSTRTDENTFRYNWQNISGIGGLMGQTVGITGMGEIGVELARRLRPFHPAAVLYHKRSPYPEAVENDLAITYAEAKTCYQRADILVNLLPYSPHTDSALDKSIFQKMKPGAVLVHAGSGSTLNEHDLAAALQSGHLSGAALDTFEYEPLPLDHPLIALARGPAANVILTPHVAAGTNAPNRRDDYAEIERFLAGERLHHRIV